MSKKMDDARRASRDRDALSKDADEPARFEAPLKKSRGRYPMCPECRDSFAHLTWNPHRELWEHLRCGFTATQQELDEGLVR